MVEPVNSNTTAGANANANASSEFYSKVLAIFTDKFTKDLYDRQAVAIEKICKHNNNGFVSSHQMNMHSHYAALVYIW